MLQNEQTSKGKNDRKNYWDTKPAKQETGHDSGIKSPSSFWKA
jgi:hypothetical protein